MKILMWLVVLVLFIGGWFLAFAAPNPITLICAGINTVAVGVLFGIESI